MLCFLLLLQFPKNSRNQKPELKLKLQARVEPTNYFVPKILNLRLHLQLKFENNLKVYIYVFNVYIIDSINHIFTIDTRKPFRLSRCFRGWFKLGQMHTEAEEIPFTAYIWPITSKKTNLNASYQKYRT